MAIETEFKKSRLEGALLYFLVTGGADSLKKCTKINRILNEVVEKELSSSSRTYQKCLTLTPEQYSEISEIFPDPAVMPTLTGSYSGKISESDAFNNAIKRYKSVSGKDDFAIAMAEPFFKAVETLESAKSMRITLQENAVKIRLNFRGNDYALDYNFEEPDTVFILSRRGEKLLIKDCKLSKISETLEHF